MEMNTKFTSFSWFTLLRFFDVAIAEKCFTLQIRGNCFLLQEIIYSSPPAIAILLMIFVSGNVRKPPYLWLISRLTHIGN